VYRAFDTTAGRDVAIKIIPFGEDGSTYVDRFRHEALALSRLKSRHTARVHDFGRDDSAGFYLVMEYIAGVALDVHALGRALLPHEVLRAARGLMAALAEAHDLGIIHRDIKPSNVLVPRGVEGLLELRLLDFGIARTERRTQVREGIGQADTEKGLVFGTPAYMAPEQLVDGTTGPGADVYAAGLVLFDLLGVGPLFPGEKMSEQMAGRLRDDPHVDARVGGPLGVLLARMLERDPLVRFANGREALLAIGNLETAPVARDELVAWSARVESGAGGVPSRIKRAVESRPPSSARSAATPVAVRLTHLHADATAALKQALSALDFAMLDALGRRERGTELGRVARAIGLAFRLELEAAALVLEGLSATSETVQAVGAALVAPRARASTRARIDPQKTDAWVDAIDPELAGMLVCAATALTTQYDAARNEARCRRALARFPGAVSPLVTTLHMGLLTASSISGSAVTSSATTEFIRLRDGDAQPPSPFHTLMRAVMLGVLTFRADEHRAREQLERAAQTAADCGVVLFEARALVAWGGMLVEVPGRVDEGLGVLERAGTLLAHGDAPSLEHIAEHNRGAALIIQGRYAEAAPHFRRARAAATGELSIEHEVLSCMNELFATLALGDATSAAATVADLSVEKLSAVSARTATYGYIGRALHAICHRSLTAAQAELRRANARASEAEASGGDAYLLAEVVGILFASARGESVDLLARAGEMEKLAQDRGFPSFYWFELLRSTVQKMQDTAHRLILLLGPLRLHQR
jgi:hypothetical protein